MREVGIVGLIFLLFGTNAYALTIYTSAHGEMVNLYTHPGYCYTFDDTKTGSSGTISSYVDQKSDDINAATVWPKDYPDDPYEPLETYDKGSAGALASSDGLLSVSTQCERLIDDPLWPERLKFKAEASWEDSFINDDSSCKDYTLHMSISPVNFLRSWWGEASIEVLSYGVDVLLNGSLLWNTTYTMFDPSDHAAYWPGSESLLIPACNFYIPIGCYSAGESFTLQYVAKAHTYMLDACELATYVGPFTVMGQMSCSPIPEPATVFLLGSGLIGLAGFRKTLKK